MEDISKYLGTWLVLADVRAEEGVVFNDLIEMNEGDDAVYIGAWVNVLIEADTIEDAVALLKIGLAEKSFEIKRIARIENLEHMIDGYEVEKDLIYEADWLLSSEFVLLISDPIFPYVED